MSLSQQFFKLNMLNKHKILSNLPADRLELSLFKSIDSTNEECKRINLVKDIHVIIAEEQTMGKGRLGKKWSSPSSGNIYMSISSKKIKDTEVPLSLITGLICANSINKLLKNKYIGLKWPNDIILSKKKVGGILVEKEVLGKDINNIIGIGINLKLHEKENWWGDLYQFGIENKRNELINTILNNFLNFFDHGINDWSDKWQDLCVHMGSEIKVKHNNKVIDNGVFIGISSDGSLNLKLKDGKIKNYEHGEISIEGIY